MCTVPGRGSGRSKPVIGSRASPPMKFMEVLEGDPLSTLSTWLRLCGLNLLTTMSRLDSFRLIRQSALTLSLMKFLFALPTGWVCRVLCACRSKLLSCITVEFLLSEIGLDPKYTRSEDRGLPQGDSLSVLFAVIWAIALHGVIRS
eukprot:6470877-Amphidinium_carterae.1